MGNDIILYFYIVDLNGIFIIIFILMNIVINLVLDVMIMMVKLVD